MFPADRTFLGADADFASECKLCEDCIFITQTNIALDHRALNISIGDPYHLILKVTSQEV